MIKPADRTLSVKEYYFSIKNRELARINEERKTQGLPPVINLGIGSPDMPAPAEAIAALQECAALPGVHGYQSYMGNPKLREAFAAWYSRYYGVSLDPDGEIQPLVGSKEGIFLLSMTFLNPGDKVLVPNPGYPTYTSAAKLTGATVVPYELCKKDGWLPDFGQLEKLSDGAKMMWVNYPHMPTGARANLDVYAKLVEFGRKHSILIVNDNPYSFILNEQPLSILSIPGAKECCMELNSLSKAHNMAGWRIGMAAGDREYVSQLLKVKSQMDSGMFRPLQDAAAAALSLGPEWFAGLNKEYKARRAAAGRIFDFLGIDYDRDSAGLFLFGEVPQEFRAEAAASGKTPGELLSDKVLSKSAVFITPGFIFGSAGNNYARISLCAPVPVLEQALERIRDSFNG